MQISITPKTAAKVLMNARPHPNAAFMTRMLALLCLLGSTKVLAWGAMGHEIAAQLAIPYLSDESQRQITSLLGTESLAVASTYADRMRSDPSHFWQKEAGPYHYVTVPDRRRYDDVGPPAQGDAATALTQFRRDLVSPLTSRKQKQLALRFAIHIIADLQQPLHVGNGRDRGGNQISVRFKGKTSNLHRVWDRQLFESSSRSKNAWLRHFRKSELLRPPTPQDANPQKWIAQSANLRESLYPAPKVVDSRYVEQQLPKAEKQLVLAGIRTAAWLNETFKDTVSNSAATQPLETTPKKTWWQRLVDVFSR